MGLLDIFKKKALNPNDNLHIVDFEFNKQVLEEEAEYYGENLDEEDF